MATATTTSKSRTVKATPRPQAVPTSTPTPPGRSGMPPASNGGRFRSLGARVQAKLVGLAEAAVDAKFALQAAHAAFEGIDDTNPHDPDTHRSRVEAECEPGCRRWDIEFRAAAMAWDEARYAYEDAADSLRAAMGEHGIRVVPLESRGGCVIDGASTPEDDDEMNQIFAGERGTGGLLFVSDSELD